MTSLEGDLNPINALPLFITRGRTRPRHPRLGLILWGTAKLSLLGIIEGGRSLEKDLHKRFSDQRVKGEWFKPSPDLLMFIESVSTSIHGL